MDFVIPPRSRRILRWALLLVAVSPLGIVAETSAGTAPLRIGTAWYPEQWPESQWDADLSLMEQAHFNVVRVGEFAWSTEEPVEGHFNFTWLDHAIALAARYHIAVVIGTPTDAPPAWLTQRYPEILRIDENGRRAEHGDRRQFNYTDPLYRRFCAKIVLQLALRYGHNPNVIGWQIGNEYTDESFDPHTRALFQQFLRDKYKTLANLNRHWTTAYWSETYTAWSQIPMESSRGNPGLLLEHKHFVTAMWRSFQRNQIDVLRPLISPQQFITTNIGGLGWSDNWDHYAIASDLDLASWDDYVGEGHLDASKNAMLNDFVRGWKRRNFWVMETEPGSVNWAPVNNSLTLDETRALAWQTIGHGADAVLYWQWRSALNGQEQYHGTIVGPDGKPNPIYPEVQQIGAEFAKASSALEGTTPRAEIALLHTYDSRWAIDFQSHTREYNQEAVLLRFYTPLDRIAESTGHAVDIVDPLRSPLNSYKLLIAPSLNVIDDGLARKLRRWIEAGGHLLLGPRSGMKNRFDALNPERQPGPLVAVLGAKVAQYYALDHSVKLMRPASSGGTEIPMSGTADVWAEALAPSAPNLQLDMLYADPGGWLDHQPAMVTRSLGRGTISYLGTLPNDEMLAGILQHAALAAGIKSTQQPDPGMELCARESPDGDRHVLVVINHNSVPSSTTIPAYYRDLLAQSTMIPGRTSSAAMTTITLPAQGVAVLVPEEQ